MSDDQLRYPELNATTLTCCERFAQALAEGNWDDALRWLSDALEWRDSTCEAAQ